MSTQGEKLKSHRNLINAMEQNRKGVQEESSNVTSERDRLEREVLGLQQRIRLMGEVQRKNLEELERRTKERVELADHHTNLIGMQHEDFRMRLIMESKKLQKT